MTGTGAHVCGYDRCVTETVVYVLGYDVRDYEIGYWSTNPCVTITQSHYDVSFMFRERVLNSVRNREMPLIIIRKCGFSFMSLFQNILKVFIFFYLISLPKKV